MRRPILLRSTGNRGRNARPGSDPPLARSGANYIVAMTNPRVAAFTMVRDESNFLDIWLRHYQTVLPQADLVVLDHLTSDDSIKHAAQVHNFQVKPVNHPAYDDFEWYTERIEAEQRELLNDHDVVVFAESDELLWHPDGLSAVVSRLKHDAIRAVGWQVIEQPDEPPVVVDRTLLPQRSTWFRRPTFDKTLITTVPLKYSHGFHHAEPEQPRDDDLLLIHLHTIDKRWAREKKRRIVTYADYDQQTKQTNLGWHNRVVDDEFDRWWSNLELQFRMEPIPQAISDAFPT